MPNCIKQKNRLNSLKYIIFTCPFTVALIRLCIIRYTNHSLHGTKVAQMTTYDNKTHQQCYDRWDNSFHALKMSIIPVQQGQINIANKFLLQNYSPDGSTMCRRRANVQEVARRPIC